MFKFDAGRASVFMFQSDELVSRLSMRSSVLKDESLYEEIEIILQLKSVQSFGVHFFGSRIIGVATDESDLDIFIDEKEKTQSDTQLEDFKEYFQKSLFWSGSRALSRASVPIITSWYRPMNLQCESS
jgi:DNA polymerase sigma